MPVVKIDETTTTTNLSQTLKGLAYQHISVYRHLCGWTEASFLANLFSHKPWLRQADSLNSIAQKKRAKSNQTAFFWMSFCRRDKSAILFPPECQWNVGWRDDAHDGQKMLNDKKSEISISWSQIYDPVYQNSAPEAKIKWSHKVITPWPPDSSKGPGDEARQLNPSWTSVDRMDGCRGISITRRPPDRQCNSMLYTQLDSQNSIMSIHQIQRTQHCHPLHWPGHLTICANWWA